MKIKTYLKGHTLLELLIVVVLITIATTIGFSSMTGYSNSQNAKIAANQITFILKQGRYYARSKGVPTKLVFLPDSNSYSLAADNVNLTKDTNVGALSGILPNGTIITNNTCNDVYFYIDGSIVDSNNSPVTKPCSITAGYKNGTQETVNIDPRSGNVIYDQ